MLKRLIIFLVLNFGALSLGGLFTNDGVTSDWYAQLNKAPWTPPGWVFGLMWTLIMISFSFYMTYAWEKVAVKKYLLLFYGLQWVLNVAWNPAFFYYHQVLSGLIILIVLTSLLLIGYMSYKSDLHNKSRYLWIYLGWLLIAISLNAYILVYNE